MSHLPDYLLEFRAQTGIDPAEWQAWRTAALTAVSGIRDYRHAVALRDFFINHMGMAADLNEPVAENGTWGVVAVPIPSRQ